MFFTVFVLRSPCRTLNPTNVSNVSSLTTTQRRVRQLSPLGWNWVGHQSVGIFLCSRSYLPQCQSSHNFESYSHTPSCYLRQSLPRPKKTKLKLVFGSPKITMHNRAVQTKAYAIECPRATSAGDFFWFAQRSIQNSRVLHCISHAPTRSGSSSQIDPCWKPVHCKQSSYTSQPYRRRSYNPFGLTYHVYTRCSRTLADSQPRAI